MPHIRQVIEFAATDRFDLEEHFSGGGQPWLVVSVFDDGGRRCPVRFEIDQDSAAAWLTFAARIHDAVAALKAQRVRPTERAPAEEGACTAP